MRKRETEDLVLDWFRRCRESQIAHYRCGSYFRFLHLLLGIPTIILSTAVGTAVFTSLGNSSIGQYKIVLGLISVTAAVLASLQTFLKLAERAEKHRMAGVGYSGIRRRLEHLATFPPQDEHELRKAIADIGERLTILAETSPQLLDSILKRTVKALRNKDEPTTTLLPRWRLESKGNHKSEPVPRRDLNRSKDFGSPEVVALETAEQSNAGDADSV